MVRTASDPPPSDQMAAAQADSRPTPVKRQARALIRCGRPAMPDRASSSRSARVLMKWAPMPSRAVAPISGRPRPRMAGQPEGHEGRQQTEGHGVGEWAEERGLDPGVVGPGRAHGHQVDPGGPPSGEERQRDAGDECGQCRGPDGGDVDGAGHDRLVGPSVGGVPGGVEPVVAPPGRELAGQDGRGHGHAPPGGPSRQCGQAGGHRGDGQGGLEVAGPDQADERPVRGGGRGLVIGSHGPPYVRGRPAVPGRAAHGRTGVHAPARRRAAAVARRAGRRASTVGSTDGGPAPGGESGGARHARRGHQGRHRGRRHRRGPVHRRHRHP